MARLRKLIIAIFVLLVNIMEVNAKSPPPGTGTSDLPANILIMLDNSGSMFGAKWRRTVFATIDALK